MTARPLTSPETQESSLAPVVLANTAGIADLSPATQSAALWAPKTEAPDPRATLSAMWASSLVWAAGSLVDLVAITVQNVIYRRQQ